MVEYNKYPEYKDSGVEWLGEIPADWNVEKLGSMASFNDKTLTENTNPDSMIRYIEISDVSNVSGINYNRPIPFKDAPSRARRIVEKGDILISTVRTYLKAVSSVQKDHDNLVASTGFAVLKAKKCDGNFLRYAVLSDSFMDKIISSSIGVSYPSIRSTKLASFKLPFPSLETQQQIVNFLDAETKKIDDSVSSMESLISLLTEKRAALISETVTRGVPGEHTEFKDSGVEWLGEIPAGWDTPRFKSVAVIKKRDNRGMKNSNLLSLSYGKLKTKDITSANGLLPDNFEGYQIIKKDEIVFRFTDLQNDKRSLRSAINKIGTGIITSAYMVACVKNKNVLNPDFFSYLMRGYDLKKVFYGIGSGLRQSVGYKELSILPITLPSVVEQLKITKFLDVETNKIDTIVGEVRASILLLKEKRQTLISDVVTGKINPESK